MSSAQDFVIENGCLVGYKGEDSNVIIPQGVISIGKSAFEECESMLSVSIPSSVISIDDYAFSCCDGLESVIIPVGVKRIARFAFYNCANLKSVVIPQGVTEIGEYAFSGCENLESAPIPSSITSIEEGAFSYCVSLVSMVIPASVKKMGCDVFAESNNLTVYCEAEKKPSGWDACWKMKQTPIKWAGQWEYDEDGKPAVRVGEVIERFTYKEFIYFIYNLGIDYYDRIGVITREDWADVYATLKDAYTQYEVEKKINFKEFKGVMATIFDKKFYKSQKAHAIMVDAMTSFGYGNDNAKLKYLIQDFDEREEWDREFWEEDNKG